MVVYLTLDFPPPATTAWRYTNGDVSMLPYSYTLSPMPALLRTAAAQADSPLCRTYTVPATSALPHPALPLDFPGLMAYLQRALEESRRAAHDRSGGLGRLAKMVEECFPEGDADLGLEGPEEGHQRRGLFSRFRRKSKAPAGGNQETYQLITPFFADEVG